MKKGQWIMIACMCGEPRMTGKIGQYESTDDKGQIHGTWGIAIQPDKDSFVLLTDEQVAEIRAEEERKKAEYRPPFIKGAKVVEVMFESVPIVSRCCWVNGVKPTRPITCKVVLDLNGCYEGALKGDSRKALIVGVPDNMCGAIYDRIRRNVGQNCLPTCQVIPCDMRKSADDYLPAIDKACKLAIGG